MSTRSSSTDLFPPFEDHERLIRRRNHGEPSLLLDFEEINMNPNNNQNPPHVGHIPHNHDNGPPGPNPQNPPPDLRAREELLHVPTDSVGDAIVVPPILAIEALGKHISTMYKPIHFIQESCETDGGPHHYSKCQAAGGFTQGEVYVAMGNYNLGVPPHPPPFSSSKEVKQDPKSTMDQVHILSFKSTIRIPYLVVQSSPISKLNEIPKRNPHQPPIPFPLRLNKEKLQDKFDIQIHKFLQMFKKLHFNISLAKALALMPKYAKMLKDLLTNKEKLIEMANTPLNENCSALANRSVAYPAGIAEDVFMQVGKFTFPADFVVVDYNVDPYFSLILGRPFLRTARALVDVHGEELILRVGDEKLTFNVDSTLKYPYKHGNESINMIDIIELHARTIFMNYYKDSDSILEETDAFLALDSIPPDSDNGIYDLKGDILFLKKLLEAGSENRPPMLNKENYVPWSSRLLRYAKSRPNGKLIHNSIINGPYVRRMIPELDDINSPHQDQPSFNQNYMEQPTPNPEDITNLTTVMNMALALMAKAFKLNYSTPTNNNQKISSNPRNRKIAQPGMNMGQDRHMQMVGDNGETQFRQYAGQNVGNLNGYNVVQNVGNQNGNGNLVAARVEGNVAGHIGN
nr:hypothetical protein [Tanacetum cinerariifolium]